MKIVKSFKVGEGEMYFMDENGFIHDLEDEHLPDDRPKPEEVEPHILQVSEPK